MPTKAKPAALRFTAWSWSRFNDHRRCAFYASLKYLKKMKEPGGPAMQRGADIHKLAEDYTRGKLAKLPPELKLFKQEFAFLKKIKADVEGQLAVTKDWLPAGWFSEPGKPEPWLRVITDARYETPKQTDIVTAIDHKTGKIYGDNEEQMSLYVPVIFAHYPKAKVAEVRLNYLDQGEEVVIRWHRDGFKKPGAQERKPSLAQLKETWTEKSRPILADKKFSPTPNEKCRYCHFRAANGGPCKY